MDTITLVSCHVVTAGADGENVGATVGVGLERFVLVVYEGDEVENVALTAGDATNDAVAPNECPYNEANDAEDDDE